MKLQLMTRETASTSFVERDLMRLRETADRVVGSIFFGTMLKTMRHSEMKGPYGHGGRAEEVFGAQLHGLYAERLGAAHQGGLQDTVYRALEKQQRSMSALHMRRGQVLAEAVGPEINGVDLAA